MSQGVDTVRVVIPCKDVDETIHACLSAVSRTRGVECQFVVVDDGGNSTLEQWQSRQGFSLVKSGNGSGAGAARNHGARGFAGRVLVFVDADVEVATSDTIATLVDPIFRGEAQATVGCYSPTGRDSFFSTYKNLYLAYTYGTRTGELKNTFWTGLCAIDRTWFEKIGGFKECYAGAGPEDIEFGIALTMGGGKVLAVPGARGTHLARLDFKGILANDLRKGSEDVYVHWARKIPLTNNRHVELADILAVAFASCAVLLLGLSPFVGAGPWIVCAFLYLGFRRKLLLKAFRGRGVRFFLQSVALSFILDLVRACAIVVGTSLWCCDRASRGKWSPFRHPSGVSLH